MEAVISHEAKISSRDSCQNAAVYHKLEATFLKKIVVKSCKCIQI